MSKKKILIIEDEEYLAEMYKTKLVIEGYEVNIARDGEIGLALAKSEQPDFILLDIVLPKKDGYEILRELRSDEKTRKIKIYAWTNLGQAAEIKRGLEGGADGYWVKANLTPKQLVENINKVFADEEKKKEPESKEE